LVSEGTGRLFRRKDDKYLIYLPLKLAVDSQFPFKDFTRGKRGGIDSIDVKVSFKPGGPKRLLIEKWKEPSTEQEK
jgi:hypothetical protein